MQYTRDEACAILGISPVAKAEEAKAAYKKLVKLYHPDTGESSDVEKYLRVVDAYESFTATEGRKTTPKIVGRTVPKATPRRPGRKEYEAYKKRVQKQKEERKADFEKREKELTEKYEKREKLEKNAIDAINAVIMAEHIKRMIRENDDKL